MAVDHIITYPMIYFDFAVSTGLTKILQIEKCIFLDTLYNPLCVTIYIRQIMLTGCMFICIAMVL